MDPQAETPVVETSRNDDVAAAFDTVAALEPTDGADAPSKPVAADAKPTPATETPTPSDKPVAAEKPETATEQAETPAVEAAEKPAEKPAPADRAPISWKPSLREHWSALPPEVKAEIQRRERDISKGLGEASEARKFHQRFNEVTRPYEHLIAMEASDPIEGFQNYLKTAAVLRQGTGWEKATSLAAVIKQFQIDPMLLDKALVNALPPQGSQAPAEYRDPRVDQLMSQLTQQQNAQNQRIQTEAQTELEAFRSTEPEFLSDVEDYMADILTVAAQKGHILSLQEAYDRAIMVHPETSEIVMKRRQSEGLQQQAQVVVGARRRALPAGGTPRVGPTQKGNVDTVRAGIEAAIEQLSGS